MNIDYKYIFIKATDNGFEWKVGINGEWFDFFQGKGYFTPIFKKPFGKNKKPKNSKFVSELEGWVHMPDMYTVLDCLLSDKQAGDETFQDFCDNLGYDTDSRKALKTYLLCQENGEKLSKVLSISEIAEIEAKLQEDL